MSSSEILVNNNYASTVENSPKPFQDYTGAFAYLEPSNEPARQAFNATISKAVKNLTYYKDVYKHLNIRVKDARERSPCSDEETHKTAKQAPAKEWFGGFVLSLDNLPQDPNIGWRLGCQGPDGNQPSDFLLRPRKYRCRDQECKSQVCKTEHCRLEHCGSNFCEDQDCKTSHCKEPACQNDGVSPHHAILRLHRELPHVLLKPRHSITITQPMAKEIRDPETHVLTNGELFMIGGFTFVFRVIKNFYSQAFQNKFVRYRQSQLGMNYHFNRALAPISVLNAVRIGPYYASPRAFAQGTFGSVFSAWKENGADVFAIKRFKRVNVEKIKLHMQVMKIVGDHDHIIRLVDIVHNNHDHITPETYAIYTPFVTADLAEVINGYQIDLSVKVTLLRDYLDGMTWLHEKGVMHRDDKPSNLGVLDFSDCKGVILDLDEATTNRDSLNHAVGTVKYLAPEVLRLKQWTNNQPQEPAPPRFGEEVDLFALGLSMHGLYYDRNFMWDHFATPNAPVPEDHSRTDALFDNFRRELEVMIYGSVGLDPVSREFLEMVEIMTEKDPLDRTDARLLLESANLVVKGLTKGGITPVENLESKKRNGEPEGILANAKRLKQD